MDNFMRSCIEEISKSALKSVELKVEQGIDGTDVAKSTIEKLCTIEQLFAMDKELAESFQCEPSKDFDKEFEKAQIEKHKTRPNPETTQRYQSFMEEVRDAQVQVDQAMIGTAHLNATSNIDNMEVQSDVVKIDPLTKRLIENPVRNKNCRHIYDKNSILEAIGLNPRIRCPYVGCSNKKPVISADLETDREYKRYLQAKSQEESMMLL